MCLLTCCVPLEYLSCSVARYTTMSNQGLHLCWQKTKRVPYLVRSARFISPLSVGIDRKSERILLCAPPWENVLYVSPCFRMERGHYRVDRASCTLRQYAAQKKKQPLSEDRMFLTCYNKERIFFIRIDQPISYGIKKWLSYSPEPQVARFHPYVEIEEMFKKRRQESKQKAFIQQQRHIR